MSWRRLRDETGDQAGARNIGGGQTVKGRSKETGVNNYFLLVGFILPNVGHAASWDTLKLTRGITSLGGSMLVTEHQMERREDTMARRPVRWPWTSRRHRVMRTRLRGGRGDG